MDVLQQTLTGLMSLQPGNSTVSANGTAAVAEAVAPQLTTLLSTLLSFSALSDWLKLFVVGGAMEACRRLVMTAWRYVLEAFWITATFQDDDSSYKWLMFWLSKQPKWAQARTVNVSTDSGDDDDPAVDLLPGDWGQDRLRFLPSYSETYTMWYKGHYMSIVRNKEQMSMYYTRETLEVKILARNHKLLMDFILDAKKAHQEAGKNRISIFVSDVHGNWRERVFRQKRALKSIVLDPGIAEMILEDARDFLESKSWYTERGVPYRRGYLLYGAPGSGKTSIIHSLAGELGLDIHVVSLSRGGLDDQSLCELIGELPERCIALMEDIDAAFHQGITRDFKEDGQGETQPETDDEAKNQKDSNSSQPASRITLSGLLNALDGIAAQEGRILFATTNRYNALDPALCRPGRMDVHIEFKLASKLQAGELFKRFFIPSAPSEEKTGGESEKGDAEIDSAYGSRESSVSPSPDDDLIQLDSKPVISAPPTMSENAPFAPSRSSHRGPSLSSQQVDELAARFSEAIPEREFSMASLQGYLMMYKIRPFEAVQEAATWVETTRAEKIAKAPKKKAATTSPAPAQATPEPSAP